MDYEIKKLINDALTEAYIRINNHDINKTIEGLIKQLRELINNTNFNDNNTNLQNIITTNIEELISMIKDVENKWNHAYKNDVNSTLKESLAGKNRVFVVKGRYGSLFLKIRGKLTSIEIEIKRNKSHSVVTQIYLRGLSTRTLIIPNMLNLSDNEFYDLRLGFRAGDGIIYEGRPAMKTRQLWQLILWSLLYPGEVEVSIKSLGFTKKSVNITWFIYSKTHKETIKNKDIAFQELEKRISSRNMLTLILSDGSIDLKKKNIKMSAGLSNYEKLSKALTPLSNELKIKYQISVKDTGAGIIFWNSNAVILARHIVNNLPNKLKKILNILEEKLNLDKWRKLKALANVSIGRMHGSSQVEIYGIKFNVLLTEKTIQLRTCCGKNVTSTR
ncbi:hypothetical protein VMUT_1626 [Vulcanisaeta moutnovskia 768-28]|uniref:Uncharacterized protein n=1 Tax=Vulcanisaeta moutnovskia (strain 768-28) TaxID=985053 RepID=F0QU44_VULM7|nr:hypothetical protein [Vulcanisaeta moutnovskia]ADY01830.1 hypothetical protein VMUT_1626 [Vulcanisaeta moutnovskia 768-28]